MTYFAWLEETGFSIWIRESEWGFFLILTLHSLSMGLAVGINLAVNLRIIGFANRVPLHLMQKFYPLMQYALIIIFLSGTLLLIAYPAKALTNSIFYLKIVCILAALLITHNFSQQLLSKPANSLTLPSNKFKLLAVLSIALWVTVITSGRFLAYTHSILLASSFY